MHVLSAIVSVLIAAAGWHYLFFSVAASRLLGVEDAATNRRRVRLRRTNGAVMLVLSGLLFYGLWTFDQEHIESNSERFVLIWIAVLVLLMVVLFLGIIDLRLTNKLRRTKSDEPKP
jgi:hypothetical protein